MRTDFVPAPYPIPATLACSTKLAKWFSLRAPRAPRWRPRLEASPPSLLRQIGVGFPRPPLPSAHRSMSDAVPAAPPQTAGFGAGPARTPGLPDAKALWWLPGRGGGWRMGAHLRSQFAKIITCSGRTDARTRTKGKRFCGPF